MQTKTEDLRAAYRDYEQARAGWVEATRMDVPTPEGAGTFGGAWDCDPRRLLRTLIAIEEESHPVSAAVHKIANADAAVIVGKCDYGEIPEGSPADVWETPNHLYRDTNGRYLSDAETAILRHHFEPRNGYFAPGAIVARWIEREATGGNPNDPAHCLLASYVTGWPLCSEQAKISACQRMAHIYQRLLAAWERVSD